MNDTTTTTTVKPDVATRTAELLGLQGWIDIDLAPGKETSAVLAVMVRVTGYRRAYGREEVQVTPVAGGGTAWKSLPKVRFVSVPLAA